MCSLLLHAPVLLRYAHVLQVVELQLAVTALVNEGWAETASSTKGQGIVEHVDIDLVGQSAVVFVGTHEQVCAVLCCVLSVSARCTCCCPVQLPPAR